MYIKTGGVSYPCRNYYPGGEAVQFALAGDVFPATVGDTISLHQDDGLELVRHRVADFARWAMEGGRLVLTNLPVPVPMPPEPPTKGAQIAALKTQLTATDYKIIKCSEYQLAGQTALPYDIGALHLDRQALRDEINRLEQDGPFRPV